MPRAARIVSLLALVAFLGRSPAADPEPNLRPSSPLPVPAETLAASVRRGVDFLVTTQNKDGSWGGPRWTGGVDFDPIPGAHYGFSAAVTAMCVEALLEVGGDAPVVKSAVERGTDYLLRELPKLRRSDPGNLPNIWGHSLGIQTLSALHTRTPDAGRRAAYQKLIREQMTMLERFETVHGGWFYYANGFQRPLAPSCSFVNASVLVSLDRAKQIGVDPPAKVVARAVQSTAQQRTPETSFIYSLDKPLAGLAGSAHPINRPAGSLGRTQACNLALRIYGDKRITDDVIKAWLDRLVTRQGWLDMGRKKPIPHESFAAVAGYFYYFGHYYAALAIGMLPGVDRPFYQDHLAKILIERQEDDGSWFDYPLYSYHKPYGTAFALLSLGCCRKMP